MPGVNQLIEKAIERAEAYESAGACKASKRDLSYYVMDIADEMEKEEHHTEWFSDTKVAVALFRIWVGEVG